MPHTRAAAFHRRMFAKDSRLGSLAKDAFHKAVSRFQQINAQTNATNARHLCRYLSLTIPVLHKVCYAQFSKTLFYMELLMMV